MTATFRAYDPLKRTLDVAASVLLLVLLSPVLLVTAVLVRVKLGAPVVFGQERPGRDGRLFTLYKFHSMLPSRPDLGAESAVDTDAGRLTPFGRALRAASLDELPELVNVLKGDMSVVGPRPLLPEYLPRYNETQARRHEVRPGITGWAQVNGRNALSWEDRFEMDVWYVDHRSFALDLRILWKTVSAVFGRQGISSSTHATMEPFQGTPSHQDKEAEMERPDPRRAVSSEEGRAV
jgi:lipopolysaccharide/colanic/teichoic acid biosynthesis glycosyltransferase